ncbi:MAG: DUF1080 domain-containing protein [Verrucomicrobia subdivision 3 bacterium]|nr:DUF1080 domain-containing protein [Limisphaerales bacterium]
MKSGFLFLIGALACADAITAAEHFELLFNGKNFDGWHNVNCGPKTWTIKEGMIHCTGKPIGELRTTRMYENFILELEWRHLKPRGNAGIFVWADAYPAKGQPFHRGVEVQVLENKYGNTRGYTTHGDIFPIHGARMTPVNGRGGQRAFPTENRSKPSPQWNHYRIVCNNGDISLAVNGKVVTRGKAASPRKGYICLESEGSPVQFRNMKIKVLPSTNPKPEEIAEAEAGFHSLYTGIDLAGWIGKGWTANDWRLTTQGGSALRTEKKFASYEMFADFRGNGKEAPFELPNVGALGEMKNLSKGWNRVRVTRRPGSNTIELNGKVVVHEKICESGPLKPAPFILNPKEPTQFANIFVKELK